MIYYEVVTLIQSMILIIPFLGTIIGSATVFFIKEQVSLKIEKLLLGFAAGVMIAASVWSLLIPSIEMAEKQSDVPWMPALTGFMLGIFFLFGIDSLVPHLHFNSDKPEGAKRGLSKTTMMLLAVTIHNIPEGMAVGVTYAAGLSGNADITLMGAMALSCGIALQNFPEGAVISTPLNGAGVKKSKAFLYGVLSGAVEPVGALLTILLTSLTVPFLPYLLSFAAGAMIYVVIEELIPASQAGEHSNIGTIGTAVGFALMMVLDVALG
ncbi:ZIP family metal transporter [Ruminococcus sp. Marseille-P6503]|uniref:ZIP family metal transporter n=1 Tax=Ruminococcus sp. Marseille-P6503 TaxID=2364796 RepID=UPI000F535AA5|nr:ZIP family metal transporter [Ruminococcus sp. Marseille-P6503]